MRYYIIAGEKSGDIHGSQLMQAIKQEDEEAVFRVWGGTCMQRSGGTLVVPFTDLAFMGTHFLSRLRKLYQYFRYCQKDLLAFGPDVLILVDYAGFNLRMAKFAKKNRIKTFYYISPKIWAWNASRIGSIKAYVDRMFTIFPFEAAWYKQYNYEVDYVGNPLIEYISLYKSKPQSSFTHTADQRPLIALLPGSRAQEIKKILPIMLAVVVHFPQYQFVVAGLSELPATLYEKAHKTQGVQVLYDRMYDILANAYTAIVASGTATLESAFFQVPQIVVYKTDFLSYMLAKRMVRTKYISLVNIIGAQEIVQELIQYKFTAAKLSQVLQDLVHDYNQRYTQITGYRKIQTLLGKKKASKTAAKLMVKYLRSFII